MTLVDDLAQLRELDLKLARPTGGVATLDPARSRATPLTELVPSEREASAAQRAALARALVDVGTAWLEHFPENIFWDLDLLARKLLELEEPALIERRARRVADLARGFGRQTEIRFQYVHDFLYGYDWARWVARDPEERENVGPFDDEFLAYLESRQAELLDLIAKNDNKYPRLASGQPRNPFGFSRSRDDERKLLSALAADDAIPVRAWRADGRCTWDRPFGRMREEKARALGLAP